MNIKVAAFTVSEKSSNTAIGLHDRCMLTVSVDMAVFDIIDQLTLMCTTRGERGTTFFKSKISLHCSHCAETEERVTLIYDD